MIDENTAGVLHGSNADVLGAGSVALVDPEKDRPKPYLALKASALRDVSR